MKRLSSFRHGLKHSENHQTKLSRGLKPLIVGSTLAMVVLVGLILVGGRSNKLSAKDLHAKLTEVVQGSAKLASPKTVESSLGFTFSYDPSLLEVEGQVTSPKSTSTNVTGTSYSGNELDEKREYSLIKVRPKVVDKTAFAGDELGLTILTNIRKDYWLNRESKPEYKGKSHLDIFIAETTKQVTKDASSVKVIGPEPITIGGNDFRKVTYRYQNDSYGIDTTYDDVFYFAVSNDRPYYANIHLIKKRNQNQVPVMEAVIKTLKFTPLDESKLSIILPSWLQNGLAKADQALLPRARAAENGLPEGTSNAPYELDPSTLLKVVARNQPSTIRIAAADCGDVQLLDSNGNTALTLKGACNGGIGSGVIVSADGYIATNGHVTRFSKRNLLEGYILFGETGEERLSRVASILGYLVQRGDISSSERQQLLEAYTSKGYIAEDKIAALSGVVGENRMRVKNENYNYAVQLSDQPLKADLSNGIKLQYSQTIVPATFVDANFNLADLEDGFNLSSASDVAILKIKGNFLLSEIGDSDKISQSSPLTALGFPAFVDGGLQTTQTTTVPTVTQGSVIDIDTQSSPGRRLFETSVPIAPGNSGGPAVDQDGAVVGLNTYGAPSCEDKKCFGEGIARDIGDYRELLAKNHIKLNVKSSLTQDWVDGLSALDKSDFATAASKFEKVSKNYPANYLAPKLLILAQSQSGASTPLGHSLSQQSLPILPILGGVGVILLISSIVLIVHLHRGRPLEPLPTLGLPPVPPV